MGVIYECVPNVSEGRDRAAIDALATACGGALLDVHSDPDHHRSVFTLADPDPVVVEKAMQALAAAAVARLDIGTHAGVHPRLGVLDVVPFVALGGGSTDREVAAGFARRFADWAGTELDLPCFLYGDVDTLGRTLPDVRREAFSARWPDHGPMGPHPTAGAAAVGARPPLIALNCVLDVDDLAVARRIASEVRGRDGGLEGVRALGLRLPSTGEIQVSMNLVDLPVTGLLAASDTVEQSARAVGRVSSRSSSWASCRPRSSNAARLRGVSSTL